MKIFGGYIEDIYQEWIFKHKLSLIIYRRYESAIDICIGRERITATQLAARFI